MVSFGEAINLPWNEGRLFLGEKVVAKKNDKTTPED